MPFRNEMSSNDMHQKISPNVFFSQVQSHSCEWLKTAHMLR